MQDNLYILNAGHRLFTASSFEFHQRKIKEKEREKEHTSPHPKIRKKNSTPMKVPFSQTTSSKKN